MEKCLKCNEVGNFENLIPILNLDKSKFFIFMCRKCFIEKEYKFRGNKIAFLKTNSLY